MTRAQELLLAADGFAGVGIGSGTVRVYLRDPVAVANLPPTRSTGYRWKR
ncbi:MAG: hypothetical protein ACR2KP_06635 [Egibacteraceae bacterium]